MCSSNAKRLLLISSMPCMQDLFDDANLPLEDWTLDVSLAGVSGIWVLDSSVASSITSKVAPNEELSSSLSDVSPSLLRS